jgi:leucyl-tRNA synthetase
MEYRFREIEEKWQLWWNQQQVYRVSNHSAKPKYYVLDMFPYPSGRGLHVGHPLGYIASDIYARFKRLKGFNVLHPMGYDAFGLPAEQYAIEMGIHPAISTAENIRNFRNQLDRIGFCYDWSREVNTSDPAYYKWTQWIFLKLFNSYFNRQTRRAEPVSGLRLQFEKEGNQAHPCPGDPSIRFTAEEWKDSGETEQENILMQYRLAYCGIGEVNWCEALGTVLANDEVINGLSERGGYPVVKKKLRQWYLRITEYAERLLKGLEQIAFSEAMKEMQSNWIGKSYGAEIDFAVKTGTGLQNELPALTIYTTRPDTIFGVDFMVLAPEHELVPKLVSPDREAEMNAYLTHVKSRSERERMAEKKISGCFTGAFAIHPFSGREIPIWVSEYVLSGYGTGAIMAVPCGDERDFKFARFFDLPVTNIIGDHFNGLEANATKDAVLENSGFMDGMLMKDAIEFCNKRIEQEGIGRRKINYKMRDAAFSRQRYWGEPFPIAWEDGIARPLADKDLPLELPHVDSYKAGPEGEGPLANMAAWTGRHLETNTMPGYAGSSWYFLRYMDPHNNENFCDRNASDYWGQVDLYIGGTEHAVGHLLYSRMWTKVLFDLGCIGFDEPYKKLVNQGMIQGSSRFVYRLLVTTPEGSSPHTFELPPLLVSKEIMEKKPAGDFLDLIRQTWKKELKAAGIELNEVTILKSHVDVNIVDGLELDLEAFRNWRTENAGACFILEDGSLARPGMDKPGSVYICGTEVEKMSKSKFNTVNPNDLVVKFGADTFRMYEMFLGPVEQSKPWDTKGIEGVHRFLKKLWRLFYDEMKGRVWTVEKPVESELKVLHKAIKKIEEDTERFSFNTAVSAFMIAVNDLSDLQCHKKEVLEQLLILLAPYAPHISEELWHLTGHDTTILDSSYPAANSKYLIESSKNYPVAINGKTRAELTVSLDATQAQVEELVLENETVRKWLEGRSPKKVIYVKNKMINVVI